ncbi:MAG TPA: ribonuclease III [Acholeplasmataceae bacterium]|nr:ribonuclease III [Acholeplasmataceae bacterium]
MNKYNLSFNNLDLYYEAFAHPSFANENHVKDYQRLEFLGDAILGFLVGEYLYKTKEFTEGEMTKLRANYVCTQANAEYSQEIGLDRCLMLGKGAKEQNEDSQSVLADIFESFLGALYLDHGLDYVRNFLNNFLFTKIKKHKVDFFVDYKSRLQEYFQAESRVSVAYQVINEYGPPHNKTFEVGVSHDNLLLGVGIGKTKKEAEQNAAKKALEKLVR